MKKNIIIAAGGTGGHVFPAVCVASALQIKGYDINFITDERGLKYLGTYKDCASVQCINTSSRLKLYVSLINNTVKNIFKLIKNRPSCVIGFGGYPSAPLVFAAQILRIKTIIHEQNAVIGKANKLLSKFADKIITSFDKTKNLQKSNSVVYIGNPTRFENDYSFEKNSNDEGVFKILIFGGSQGAKIFSECVVDAICNISKVHKLKIYQQARFEDIAKIQERYREFCVEGIVIDFFENINEIYKDVDLVISRSGASSVFEIIGFRKPAVLVPYKKSINGDQEENAKVLENFGAAIVLDESNISIDIVCQAIKSLIDDKSKLDFISASLDKIFIPNVSVEVAKEIEKTILKIQ